MLSIGNLLTICGSTIYLLNDHYTYKEAEVFLGSGCAITWYSIVKYIANTQQDFALISRTFKLAIPMLTKTMIGWSPIFMAYVLLGTCLFWRNFDYMDSIPNTFFTCFAVMNGDSCGDAFTGSTIGRLLLGQIYWYSFTILGICVL